MGQVCERFSHLPEPPARRFRGSPGPSLAGPCCPRRAQLPLPEPGQLELRINPLIDLAAMQAGMDRPYWLSLVLKALINPDRGYVDWEEAKALARELGIPLPTFYPTA